MRVLSLFDGMACGYEALVRAGIPIDVYYASEIDKYAIQIAKKNHPDIIEIGDVCQIKGEDYKDIDIIIGGSPCQGFSMAGKMLNFDDPRSKLFFEFVRLVKEIQPKYFLLENVKMKKEFQDVISSYMGVEPIEINSALVSAQNRKRLYWTNIPGITQPEDKGILLKDIIIKEEVEDKYYLTETQLKTIQRNFGSKGKILNDTESLIEKMTFPSRIKQIEGFEIKTPTLPAAMGTGGGNVPVIAIAYAPGSREYEQQGWKTEKAPTLCARDYKDPKVIFNGKMLRKLTPIECERLQTLPDNYTEGVSNTQRYKMLGNGWTCDVISHIFSFLPKE